MKHIETKKGLAELLARMERKQADSPQELEDFAYWVAAVKGCITEGLAMDETDYENAPKWLKPLWTCLH